MKIELEQNNLFDKKTIDRLSSRMKEKVIGILRESMYEVLETGKKELSADVASNLNWTRKGSIVSGRVYDKFKESMPQLHFFSRVPWLGQHEEGGIVNNALIANTVKRMKYNTLLTAIETLARNKNLYVMRRNGVTIFYAMNRKEDNKILSKFKKMTALRSGSKIKKNDRVYIAFKYDTAINIKKIHFSKLVNKQANDLRDIVIKKFKQQENFDFTEK